MAGLACLTPLLAWRGAATGLDAALAACFAAPIAAAVLAGAARTDFGRTAGAALAGAGAGGLAACGVAASGPAALPLLLLLAAEPLDAAVSGQGRSAVAAALGAFAGLGAGLAFAAASPPDPAAGVGALAAAILILWAFAGSVAARWRERRLWSGEAAVPSRRRDDELLDVACDLVTWHDEAGDVLKANAAAARLAGAPPRLLRGGGLLSRVHVSDRPAFLKALNDAANGAGPVSVEYRLHAGAAPHEPESAGGGGRVVPVEMRVHRLVHDGSGAAVVAFTRDNSVQRQHAEELDRARREAERANEMKGRFLATVSHELRTPLNAIIGFSELMAVDHPYVVTEERRKEYATIIRNSGHHLLEIVNTLLDMSKIETGNFTFDPEPFSLYDLAESCCDLMHLKADEAGLTVVRRLDPGLPPILADRRACRQILINLLSNAVKFTPSGGSVTVSLAHVGDRLQLAVSDTGIGIPENDLPRLGDPFFQSGEVHRRSHEGTGLGLSVVRGLVGLHDGALSIESGTGAGTTVTVSLPLAGAGEAASSKPATVHALPRRPVPIIERKSA